jgi:radical SAM superfamily enzyme YgiQ (UPF0313 family)
MTLERWREILVRPNPRPLDLLLVACPPWDISSPPLNLAFLTGFMNGHGIASGAWDVNIQLHQELADTDLARLWNHNDLTFSDPQTTKIFFDLAPGLLDAIAEQVIDSEAKYIGCSIHSRNFAFAERLAAKVREMDPSRVFIYGGPHTTFLNVTDDLKHLHADAYVLGEGEDTMLEALRMHRETGKFEPIPGLAVPIDEGLGLKPFTPRAPNSKLSEMPFSDFDDFDIDAYEGTEGIPTLPFLFSRACVRRCAFCSEYLMFSQFRVRTPEHAVAEIERLVKRYQVTQFRFNDLLCNGDLDVLSRFCDLLIEKDLGIEWRSNAIIHSGMSLKLFMKMSDAGCRSLIFGLESGSDRVLEQMDKRYTASEAQQTIRRCAEAGINVVVHIIVGFPGEGEAEFVETLKFILRNAGSIYKVSNLSPLFFPIGTEVEREAERFGIVHGEGFDSWYTKDGVGPVERAARLHRVWSILEELELGPIKPPSMALPDLITLHIERLEPGMLSRMQRSGTGFLRLDLASGSDAVLSRMEKTHTSADASLALDDLADAEIGVAVRFLVGHSGETDEEFAATLDFLIANRDLIGEIEMIAAHGESSDVPVEVQETRLQILAEAADELELPIGELLRPWEEKIPVESELDWRFEQGCFAIVVGDEQVLAEPDIYWDWDTGGKRYFSDEVRWENKDGSLVCRTGDLTWELQAEIVNGKLEISFFASTAGEVTLDRMKVNLILPPAFESWAVAEQNGQFPYPESPGPEWDVLGPRDDNGNLPFSKDFHFPPGVPMRLEGTAAPSINWSVSGEGFVPVLQARCSGGSNAGYFSQTLPSIIFHRKMICKISLF